jgi:hypothetical protein
MPYTGIHEAYGKEVKIQLAIFTGTGISSLSLDTAARVTRNRRRALRVRGDQLRTRKAGSCSFFD